MEKRNTQIIPSEALKPNSCKILLSVIINVENPIAVVRFDKNIGFPTRYIELCNAFILFPFSANSRWNLFIKYTQFGTLIMMINDGSIAVTPVNSYPSIPIQPNLQTTETVKTIIGSKTLLKERNVRYNDDTNKYGKQYKDNQFTLNHQRCDGYV